MIGGLHLPRSLHNLTVRRLHSCLSTFDNRRLCCSIDSRVRLLSNKIFDCKTIISSMFGGLTACN